jgi:hypothetical protein
LKIDIRQTVVLVDQWFDDEYQEKLIVRDLASYE